VLIVIHTSEFLLDCWTDQVSTWHRGA